MTQFDAKGRILPAGTEGNTIKLPSGQPMVLRRFLNQDTQNKKKKQCTIHWDVTSVFFFFKQPCLIGLGNYIRNGSVLLRKYPTAFRDMQTFYLRELRWQKRNKRSHGQ